MRLLRVLVVIPLWVFLVAASPAPSPTAQAAQSPSPSPAESASPSPPASPSPSPSPTPVPVNAFLSLDVTAGVPSTVINVSGGQFLANEVVTLYWDTPNKVAGSATADGGGSFNTRVKPFAGDAPGVHKLCASVPPNPCANFTVESATPTPSPSPSPPESPSPSPDETPTPVASGARITPSLSGFDVISRPPFVFLPLFGAGAILLSLAYWAIAAIRRPRRPALLPAAAVVHRATRPDYSAGFGTPPPTPARPELQSAWNEPMVAGQAPAHSPPPPAPAAPPEPTVEWGPPVEWGTGASNWGLPEPPPADSPEAPRPGV